MELGWEGYGLFWALIELLRNESDHRMRTHCKSIAFALQTQEETIKRIINDFDLFVIDDKYFWSESLLKRMELKEERSEKARESAKKRWNKDIDANAMRTHSERNADAMQLKERKGKEIKEIKEKESKINEDSHNAIFRELWNNRIWLEGLAMTWKADLKEVQNHLNTFRQECILKSDYKENEKLAKEHFFNWVKRGNPIPKQESGKENIFDKIYRDMMKEKEQLKQSEQ
jgi:hypothetical protein